MKRLLILGGANQHVKLVKAAKSLGIYTIVADYLNNSPAKLICDEPWLIDIFDTEKLVERCRKEPIDGVIAGFLDPCQIPYFKLCQRLDLPCYGSERQFHNFTNKKAFKAMCQENNVGFIHDYGVQDVISSNLEYPVYVKPVDSRGSRGQSICWSKEQISKAIEEAKKNSSDSDYIIEQYMDDCDEFQVTYFVIDGKPFLERTVDSYKGSEKYGLNKVVNCSISPSRLTESYIKSAHPYVMRMIENMGIKNGPVFMQGFHRKGEFYFFDPGLRFPGVEYELIVKGITGVDFMSLLVRFALTGDFGIQDFNEGDVLRLNGKYGAILFPVLRDGRISAINGVEQFLLNPKVVSYNTRYSIGDVVDWTADVNQRFAEIDIVGDSFNDITNCITTFNKIVNVLDEKGNNMLFDSVDTSKFKYYL